MILSFHNVEYLFIVISSLMVLIELMDVVLVMIVIIMIASSWQGTTAVIYTTEYRLSEPHCATFDVHLYSEKEQTALLQVYNVGEGTIEDGLLILHETDNLGVDWATLQVLLEW